MRPSKSPLVTRGVRFAVDVSMIQALAVAMMKMTWKPSEGDVEFFLQPAQVNALIRR